MTDADAAEQLAVEKGPATAGARGVQALSGGERRWVRWLAILCLLSVLSAFLVDLRNTRKYGGADFRPRVVGYRLATSGHNPYRFIWTPGTPPRLVDPYLAPGLSLTRLSVTPTTLLLNAPLSSFSYSLQRYLWLLAQWLLLLAAIALLARRLRGENRLVFLIGCALLICDAFFWRLHVERGQVYVVYAFAFTCACVLALRETFPSDLAAGAVLGFAVALRPTYALAFVPLLLAGRWRLILAGLGGAASGVALPLLAFHPSIWRQYVAAMTAQGRQYLRWFGPPPLPANSWYPRVIEGRSVWTNAGFPTIDASVAKIVHHAGIAITPGRDYIALGLTLVVLVMLLWLAGWRRHKPLRLLLLQGGIIAYVAEFFLLATRFSYRDVMVVPLVAIVVAEFGTAYLRRSPWAMVLVGGLVLGTVVVSWLPFVSSYAIFGSDYAVFVGEAMVVVALVALTWIATRRQQLAGLQE